MKSYTVKFSNNSTHSVQVVLHKTTNGMRRTLKRIGHKDPSRTLAACWQPDRMIRDGDNIVVAEIHLCVPHLNRENIIHESSHAAFHRATLAGIPMTDDNFQEWVADDTGRLSVAIMVKLGFRRHA